MTDGNWIKWEDRRAQRVGRFVYKWYVRFLPHPLPHTTPKHPSCCTLSFSLFFSVVSFFGSSLGGGGRRLKRRRGRTYTRPSKAVVVAKRRDQNRVLMLSFDEEEEEAGGGMIAVTERVVGLLGM